MTVFETQERIGKIVTLIKCLNKINWYEGPIGLKFEIIPEGNDVHYRLTIDELDNEEKTTIHGDDLQDALDKMRQKYLNRLLEMKAHHESVLSMLYEAINEAGK